MPNEFGNLTMLEQIAELVKKIESQYCELDSQSNITDELHDILINQIAILRVIEGIKRGYD